MGVGIKRLHDVLEVTAAKNGNSAPKTKLVEGVETIIAPTTAEEKAHRRLELKARSTLLMGIPNEHQLKFKSIKDAKSLLQAVKKSLEVLDQTFDMLQKLISQLEIHGETILQEVVNQKFLRNLSLEWNTHTIMWRNKPVIDTLSLDDLYNNLKIYEPEVADGYANNEGKEILEEDLKEVFYKWAPKNQENKNKETTRRTIPVETTTSNALISCDGAGYYWSDQAEEGPTNFTLIAYTSTSSNSEVSTDSNCSSSCLENVKILKEQNEQLLKDLRTSKLNVIAYKTCLESVEARLLVYKKNEYVYEEDIKVLKREIHSKELAITELRKNFGYNAVPPPYIGNFMPPKPDLSFSGLEEFVNEPIASKPTVKKPEVETSEAKASADKPKDVRKNNGALVIEEWVFDNEDEAVSKPKIEKKTVKPSFAKIEFGKSKKQVKSPRKTIVNQGNKIRQNTHSPRGNQRNWNYMMSQRLGSNFEMINKACYVRGSFDHLQYDFNYHQRKFNNKEMGAKVNTAKPKAVVNAARPKAVLNAIKGNHVNAGNPQQDLKEKGVINSGCSRHMTGNMSYLTDFEEIDRGYVAFGGSPK
ncbi:hypothetical protein Tco_1236372 [Tanacetum coccineum]